jgi:guanine deaminase
MVADRTFYQAFPELLAAMPDPLRHEALQLQMAPPEASADAVIEAIADWPFDDGRIRPGLAPTIPLHCSDNFLLRCRDIATDYQMPLHMHLAESKVQAIEGLKRYGRTLTAHVAALGLLGPRFAAVHGIWLDDDDRALLADAGASVVHAPTSNMRFGSGLAAVRALRDRGVNVGIATDATNSSDSLNMFEATRLAALMSRVQDSDFSQWLDAPEVFVMATEGSAQALGFAGHIGRIEAGYQADLVFLDLSHINYVPLGNALRQVVYTENGAAVDSVMVAGRLVVDHGRITTIDEAKLRRDAEAAAAYLLHANAPLRASAARLQPTVEQFCRSFACRPYHVHRLACAPA